MTDVDTWLDLPPGITGQQIRHREIWATAEGSIRIGGREPKVIVAETREYVIYQVWSSKGTDLGEFCVALKEFEEKFERRDFLRSYRELRQEEIIDRYGWVGFLEHKVNEYRHWKDANCGLLTFLGMTEDEYAAFVLKGEVADRVKRVWS